MVKDLNLELVVYTYGSPRVGNKEFANYYSKEVPKTNRVINNNDIVPKSPSSLLGYKHVGYKIHVLEVILLRFD
jgi:predicted lipase